LSGQRAGATAAGTGGAGKTVDASVDLAPLQTFRRDVPQVNPGLVCPAELQVEHLIEVAIIKLASVADAERGAAHQAGDRRRIETVDEQFEIFVPSALFVQVLGEAGDRLIGNREQFVENDAELASQDF